MPRPTVEEWYASLNNKQVEALTDVSTYFPRVPAASRQFLLVVPEDNLRELISVDRSKVHWLSSVDMDDLREMKEAAGVKRSIDMLSEIVKHGGPRRRRWPSVVMFLFVLFVAYLVGQEVSSRTVPVQIVSSGPETRTTTRGGTDAARFTFWRTESCPTYVTRELIDSSGARYPLEPLTYGANELPIEEDDTVRLTFKVPEIASPGRMIYRSFNSYACTWVQRLLPPLRIKAKPRDVIFEVTG